jgi:phosphate-selective porin OprO/OprP
MKRLIVLSALGFIAVLASDASARSLEDVLKEKGVITEEDYKEVIQSRPIKYKPGEGFNLTFDDEKFSSSMVGLFKIRYTLMDFDAAQDYSKFELKGIKLMFNGNAYSRDLTYRLFLNFSNIAGSTTSNGGILEETWMNYRLRDEVQFRFGQDKVQFGRQFITSAAALQFVDQSIVTNAFAPGYDTGISINGKVAGGLFNYNIAGLGGVGQNTYRTTTDNALAVRVTVNPLGEMKYSEPDLDDSAKPLLSFGANFYRNTLYVGEPNNIGFAKSSGWYGIGKPIMRTAQRFGASEPLDFNTFGIDSAFKWHGVSVSGEYFAAQAKGQTTHHLLRAEGFYAQAGYFVIPKQVEIAYRYSYLDPNRDVTNVHCVENSAAISWYINNNNLKLQADYTNVHKQATIASTSGVNPTDDQQVRFQAQILF